MSSGLKTAFWLLCCLIASPAAAWDLASLGAALAKQPDGRVDFTEQRRISYLDTPLTLEGYLLLDGDRLEKHVLAPTTEHFVAEGDHVEIETARGEHHSFNLDDHPMLNALVTALRASLRGDLKALRQEFEVALEGDADAWQLSLVFENERAKPGEAAGAVVLAGARGRVNSIRIEEPDGDTSVMTLEHRRP